MNTRNVNGKTAARKSSERWEAKACLFVTQAIGRYSVKFRAPCVGGGVTLNCSHITNASNALDAVARFKRETSAADCHVYAVNEIEPVQPVCLSTTGYRLVQRGYIWFCLDTGVFIEVAQDGNMRRGDNGLKLPDYGSLTRI